MRKGWDVYFMDIAHRVAERSTCDRRQVGAVIVKDRRIKGAGYNGSPSGLPHCLTEGCLMINSHCIRTIHAEINALLECTPDERQGATIYITDRPCSECSKVIINCGIVRVVFDRDYPIEHDWFVGATWVSVEQLVTQSAGRRMP